MDNSQGVDTLEQTVAESDGADMSDMESAIEELEKQLQDAEAEQRALENQYKHLLEEQDKLDEIGHQLYKKVSVQDEYLHQVKATDEMQDCEITRARALRDDVREQLYKKEEELAIARRRLDEQNMEFFRQFEEYKNDVRRQRLEAQPLLDELDSFNTMTVTRLEHFTKSDGIAKEDLEKAEKLKKFLECVSRYRKLFDEVGDLQFEIRNSERALEFSRSQVKAKLGRMEDLERELSETQGVFGEPHEHFLKRAPRCMNLAQTDAPLDQTESDDDAEGAEKGEIGHSGGVGIHRCSKVTNFRVQIEKEDRAEIAAAEEEEEEEEEEDSLPEVVITKEVLHDDEEDVTASVTVDTGINVDLSAVHLDVPAEDKDDKARMPIYLGATMEGATVSEKYIPTVTRRQDLLLYHDSLDSVTTAHRAELRATGSQDSYLQTEGRKQKK